MSYQRDKKVILFHKEMRAGRRLVVVSDAVKQRYGFGWLFFQVCVLWWGLVVAELQFSRPLNPQWYFSVIASPWLH